MKYKNINYLLGAYYHQDWFYDKPDPLDITDLFIEKETKEKVDSLKKELEILLDSNEIFSEDFIFENNGYYVPSSDQLTVREWFSKILEKLS